MGSPPDEVRWGDDECPVRQVTTLKSLAVGKCEMTLAEWGASVASEGCGDYQPSDEGWGRDRQPVFSVSWDDVRAYSQAAAPHPTLNKSGTSSLAGIRRLPSGRPCADGWRPQRIARLRSVPSPIGRSSGAEIFGANVVLARCGQRAPSTRVAVSDGCRRSMLGAPKGRDERSAPSSLIAPRAVCRLPTCRRSACLETQSATREARRHRRFLPQNRDETLESLS